ncbi:response regulator transcription factor [Synechococcus sp. CS-1328]|uniref:response regulator transcription factor n=1 Tax=Synechococcus sp. CS-1328 TaxID=2847976 RepID=UPI00223C333B|nr:response regulator transcription factor [Synechococcus sp. CS-1328]
MEFSLDGAFCSSTLQLGLLSERFRLLIATGNRAYALALATHFALDPHAGPAHLVGICTTTVEALEHVRQEAEQPDHPDLLVFVSEVLEDGLGVDLVRMLQRASGRVRTLLTLTTFHRQPIREAIASGADAVVSQVGTGPALLLEALTSIVAGKPFLDPICRHLLEGGASSPQGELTEREVEVLQLVAQGLTNREMGQRLHIAETTARGHVQAIIQKLQVRDRTAAAAEGLRQGYVH